MKIKYILLIICGLFLACSSEDNNNCDDSGCKNNVSNGEKSVMEDFIASKGWAASTTCDGVFYVIDNPGSATKPNKCSSVKVNYVGKFFSGEIFDSSTNPLEFSLNGVIDGWRSGIPVFGEGGSGKLIIPPSLGYGASGNGPVPGNSFLVFEVELLEVL
jgi:FKBP-type peptidyl-prolyl cis-trans isomerase FkpA